MALYKYAIICLPIYLLMEIWVAYHLGAVNKAIINISVQIFIWTYISFSLG